MAWFGLSLIIGFVTPSHAIANIWKSTFGQTWFYEVSNNPGQLLAGTWWESSLSPGDTYRISFKVNELEGRIGVLLGGNEAITINAPGSYDFDFHVAQDDQRRLLFQAQSGNVLASVNSITVSRHTQVSSQGGGSGGSNWLPRGHYVSFARQRNLLTEVLNLIDKPWQSPSDFHTNRAQRIDGALRTHGVKGFWMPIDWRTVEYADGKYNWKLLDANMAVANRYNLKLLIKVADRSFDGSDILPQYFPNWARVWTKGNGKSGFISKRWSPYVYNRTIRLYKAIANRYANNPAFGGIATAETAVGTVHNSGYSLGAYRSALTQIVTQTQAAMTRGKLLLYMNFLKHGDDADMRRDARVGLLRNVSHNRLVVGGPDITPDVAGMPGSASAYRIHTRKRIPAASQFCHMQHVDQGLNGRNAKNNKHRREYFDLIANRRAQESKPWFSGQPGIFEEDDLRAPNGNKVRLHPNWVLGDLWKPSELFHFARRNFACDYYIWHYREDVGWNEFGWPDIRQVIMQNPNP